MATITLFGVSTPTSGNVITGDELDRELYLPTAPSGGNITSFEGINGWLGNHNADWGADVDDSPPVNWQVKTHHLQKGAASGAGAVGSTANLDFFKDFYSQVEGKAAAHHIENTPPSGYQGIPGAVCSFYLPYDASAVVFTWNISWVADNHCVHAGGGIEDYSTVKFMIKPPQDITGQVNQAGAKGTVNTLDAGVFNGIGGISQLTELGTLSAGLVCRRSVRATRHSNSMTPRAGGTAAADVWAARVHEVFDAQRHREYSGHYTVNGAKKGHYTAGLFLAQSGQQTRIRVRSMRYIYFR